MKRILSSLTGLALCIGLFAQPAHAAITSYDALNLPVMYLSTPITSPTQTTNIKIAALQRNGETVTNPSTTGAVLRITQGSKVEDMHYTSATVDPVTKVTTLIGVTRNLCWNVAREYRSCGNGETFSRGAIVQLNTDARILNLKANIDRPNVFSASGAISFSGSGSFKLPFFANPTARDQRFNAPQPFQLSCLTDTGKCSVYAGGAWTEFATATGSFVNASDSVAGKVQIITLAHLQSRTATGSTGAQNVLTPRWVVKNASGSVSAGRIPQLNHNGLLDASFGAMGSGTYAMSGVLLGNHNKKFTTVAPSSSGNYLRSNGQEWVSTGAPSDDVEVRKVSIVDSSEVGASSTAQANMNVTYDIPAGDWAAGSAYCLRAEVEYDMTNTGGTDTVAFTVRLDSNNVVAFSNITADNVTNQSVYIDACIVARTTGASASVYGFGERGVEHINDGNRGNSGTATVDMTQDLTLQISAQFNVSDSGNNAKVVNFIVTKLNP